MGQQNANNNNKKSSTKKINNKLNKTLPSINKKITQNNNQNFLKKNFEKSNFSNIFNKENKGLINIANLLNLIYKENTDTQLETNYNKNIYENIFDFNIFQIEDNCEDCKKFKNQMIKDIKKIISNNNFDEQQINLNNNNKNNNNENNENINDNDNYNENNNENNENNDYDNNYNNDNDYSNNENNDNDYNDNNDNDYSNNDINNNNVKTIVKKINSNKSLNSISSKTTKKSKYYQNLNSNLEYNNDKSIDFSENINNNKLIKKISTFEFNNTTNSKFSASNIKPKKKHNKNPKNKPIAKVVLDINDLIKENIYEKINEKKEFNYEIREMKTFSNIKNNNYFENLNKNAFLNIIDTFSQPNKLKKDLIHSKTPDKNKMKKNNWENSYLFSYSKKNQFKSIKNFNFENN